MRLTENSRRCLRKIDKALRCTAGMAGFIGGTPWQALVSVISPCYATAGVAELSLPSYSANNEHQRQAQKQVTLPLGKVWRACYKYSLTANTEQRGDNTKQNNSLLSGGCPSGTMDEVGTCVQLDISHAVKGCTRISQIDAAQVIFSRMWVAD